MTHNEIKQKLFALYDGPLTEKERVLVEVHLAACPECRRAVGEWENISGTLFPNPAFSEMEEDRLVAKVMGRIRPQSSSWSPWKTDLKWFLPLLGSALAAAWVFFVVLPNSPALEQQPLTMSLLNAVRPEPPKAVPSAPRVAQAKRTIPTFAFRPVVQFPQATPVQLYRPLRPNDSPADPFVQAVVYSY